MLNLICLDRDGTIHRDPGYLGSRPCWKSQIDFLPGVIPGISLLNKIPETEIFIVTNQPAAAFLNPEHRGFTLERMNEVNEYIISLLAEKCAFIRGYFACPYLSPAYAEHSRKKGKVINESFITENHPDWKPNPGMVIKAAQSLNKTLDQCNTYVIGDRLSDLELAINAGGTGIMVPSPEAIRRKEPFRALYMKFSHPGRIMLANDFLEAAEYIFRRTT